MHQRVLEVEVGRVGAGGPQRAEQRVVARERAAPLGRIHVLVHRNRLDVHRGVVAAHAQVQIAKLLVFRRLPHLPTLAGQVAVAVGRAGRNAVVNELLAVGHVDDGPSRRRQPHPRKPEELPPKVQHDEWRPDAVSGRKRAAHLAHAVRPHQRVGVFDDRVLQREVHLLHQAVRQVANGPAALLDHLARGRRACGETPPARPAAPFPRASSSTQS